MQRITIEPADNGFVLCYQDPAIVKRNRDSDHWEDPERRRVYSTPEALAKDLMAVLPLMEKPEPKPENDYNDALAEAFSKGSD